ncbi:hypothetical protein JCM3775_006299 [Rhodotorula graminis]|uniref:GPN-loop GTPase 2 n=1 Tax=Rhodotorula graminis (strain WP1) TaxID=578459 RepID=A0A0P9IQX4_RHOGW|nr:uncharacterized protein RHOBADRAFT_49034 [Rhodotorula graminis WP1]KPV71820.1 hypothetical protein RHOBADRAFT_49034 [Rhodotorula graminis WP1]
MPFGQVVIGPPGSGKTTYVWGLHQFFTALERPILLVNLDPAAPSPPYPHSVSIADLISLDDAMSAHGLGPNGAMLYCLEYLEANLDWLDHELDRALTALEQAGPAGGGAASDDDELDPVSGGRKERRRWRRDEMYVVFDTPGQVELSTNHDSLKHVLEHLRKRAGFRLAAVHLMDASHILDAPKYVAVLLLALRTMLQLELPHVNVLSKVDLLGQAGDLPFNLDYYTEVQDLSYLLPFLERDQRTQRFGELNRVICDLVEEFGLVGFETLAVEDKDSMLRLVQVIDQALGYVPPALSSASPSSSSDPHTHSHPQPPSSTSSHTSHHAHAPHPSFAQSQPLSTALHAGTVQEKWVDHAREYEVHERGMWEKEGEWAAERATEESRRRAVERARREAGGEAAGGGEGAEGR